MSDLPDLSDDDDDEPERYNIPMTSEQMRAIASILMSTKLNLEEYITEDEARSLLEKIYNAAHGAPI